MSAVLQPWAPLVGETYASRLETRTAKSRTLFTVSAGMPGPLSATAMPDPSTAMLIERKLDENGVGKILPDDNTLADAYRRMRREARMQEIIDQTIAAMDDTAVPVPESLRLRLTAAQDAAPHQSWDALLRGIAERDHGVAAP